MQDSVLNSRGDSDPELRRAVEHQAAARAGRLPEGGPRLPQELSNYVDKIALNAFKVTAGDIKALRDAGYSSDESDLKSLKLRNSARREPQGRTIIFIMYSPQRRRVRSGFL